MKRLLILALAMTSSAALAQSVLTSRPPVPDEARLAIETYGRCVAKREPGETRRVLLMDFTSDRYDTALHRLSEEARQDCARASLERGTAMRSDELLFAGALAEALLKAEATPLNVRLARNAAVEVPSYSPTDAVAHCLARSLPDQVATLFATAPGSGAEAAAAAPLSQALPACTRAAGIEAQVELSVAAIRAMTATAAYRLVAKAGDTNA